MKTQSTSTRLALVFFAAGLWVAAAAADEIVVNFDAVLN
jgi:hypothetical protein